MALPADQYQNPEKWLAIKGQDCENCRSIEVIEWDGIRVVSCSNEQAPRSRRSHAPACRCYLYRHKGAPSDDLNQGAE